MSPLPFTWMSDYIQLLAPRDYPVKELAEKLKDLSREAPPVSFGFPVKACPGMPDDMAVILVPRSRTGPVVHVFKNREGGMQKLKITSDQAALLGGITEEQDIL